MKIRSDIVAAMTVIGATILVISTLRGHVFIRRNQERNEASQHPSGRSALPDIIYAMADDLGYGDMGYNGGRAFTPNLDAMASGPHTIHLTRYYSGGPVCSPTRGTVLTGRNHNRYCIWHANAGPKRDFVTPQSMPLPPSEITVAEILKEHDYHTATFGKWHVGDFKRLNKGHKKWPVSHPGMHGFDEWLSTLRAVPTLNSNCYCFEATKDTCPNGHYLRREGCSNYYTIRSEMGGLEALDYPIEEDDSMFLVEQLESYLEKVVNTGKPFFVYLAFHAVHIQFIATAEDRERYKIFTPAQADYYGSLTAMDTAMGKVRELLAKYNIQNNTMLWFTSDNGPERRTPGVTGGFRGEKRSLYEGGIRVPGLIEWPSIISSNRKSDFPVMSNDLLPTICDILGTTPPTDRPIDGESIMPFIRGEVASRNSSMKWAYNLLGGWDSEHQAAISDDKYKLYAVYAKKRAIQTELYDLTSDPYEKEDIKTAAPEVHDAMKQELEKWLESVENSSRNVVKCVD